MPRRTIELDTVDDAEWEERNNVLPKFTAHHSASPWVETVQRPLDGIEKDIAQPLRPSVVEAGRLEELSPG